MDSWVVILLIALVRFGVGQPCSGSDDFSVLYSGVPYLTVSKANNTVICNQLQTAAGGTSRLDGSLRVAGPTTFLGVVNFNGGLIDLGANQTVRGPNAGQIGYGTFDSGIGLDLVGAGLTVGTRQVNLWDNVKVFSGLAIGGSMAVQVSSPGLTINAGGLTVMGGQNVNLMTSAPAGSVVIGASGVGSSLTVFGLTTLSGGLSVSTGGVQVAGGQIVNLASSGSAGSVNVGASGIATPLTVYGVTTLAAPLRFQGSYVFRQFLTKAPFTLTGASPTQLVAVQMPIYSNVRVILDVSVPGSVCNQGVMAFRGEYFLVNGHSAGNYGAPGRVISETLWHQSGLLGFTGTVTEDAGSGTRWHYLSLRISGTDCGCWPGTCIPTSSNFVINLEIVGAFLAVN